MVKNEIKEYMIKREEEINADSRVRYISLSDINKDNIIGIVCEVCDLYSNKHRSTLVDISENITKERIDNWLDYTLDGIQVINEINEIIREYGDRKDKTLRLMYKWGNNEKSCKVVDWSSTRIVIKLSVDAIKGLILYKKEFKEKLEEFDYTDNICEFIEEFNSKEFNKIISARLESVDIMGELSKYMIEISDIRDMIDNYDKEESKTIKSVFKIEEISLIGLINWKLSREKIEIEVYDKIIDVANKKIIRSKKVYDALETILKYSVNYI